jgi:hypothetical protein
LADLSAATEVLKQWLAAEQVAREQEAMWPALQQLLVSPVRTIRRVPLQLTSLPMQSVLLCRRPCR